MLRYCQQTSDNLSNPHRMAQETVPLLPSKLSVRVCGMKNVKFIIGRRQKQHFLHYPIRYGARNAVFATKPKGESKETTCMADSTRIIIGNNVVVA